jgi:hypothetical protein
MYSCLKMQGKTGLERAIQLQEGMEWRCVVAAAGPTTIVGSGWSRVHVAGQANEGLENKQRG